jgi:hypothetical protein
MKIDIHVTTCNHSSVKCRDRQGLPNWSNIKPWTNQERVEISKLSVESIKNFIKHSTQPEQISKFSLLDDGSDLEDAVKWLASIEGIDVIKYPHRGSSAVINDYYKTINSDLIFHIEDDHICFNPFRKNIVNLCEKILTSKLAIEKNIKVITFRSGLPTAKNSLGLNGAWGPVDFLKIDNIPLILFNRLGNAHHIMLKKDYDLFFPLIGNTGGCESYMNDIMERNNIKNAEIQDYIYMFHSHTLNFDTKAIGNTDEWNKSGDGFEYGIKDMHNHLLGSNLMQCTIFEDFLQNKKTVEVKNYFYA